MGANVGRAQQSATGLPLLPLGNHLGMMVSYDKLPAETAKSVKSRWKEALAAGMQVGRVHLSWAELEPRPGKYDLSDLRERLDLLEQDGLAAFVLVETIDSEEYTLPPDLMDPNDNTKLANNLKLDDPAILDRFQKLLDRIVPEMVSRGTWLLSVGNEPDNTLDDLENGSLESIEYWDAIVGFTRSARDHVRTLDSRLAVTMTLTQRGLELGRTNYGQLIDVVDVAAFNYYCQDVNFMVHDVSIVRTEIAQMLAVADGRSIVFQELGCPAGYAGRPSVVHGTPEVQQHFLTLVADELHREPRLRAAFWFTMVDWSPKFTKLSTAPIRNEGFAEFADKFEESLRTCGLVHYENGKPRPAWDAFLAALRKD